MTVRTGKWWRHSAPLLTLMSRCEKARRRSISPPTIHTSIRRWLSTTGSWRRAKYVKASVIGKSVHGRDIPLMTITDPQSPDTEKRRAFILGGTHGAENASIYGVEGMLDFLVSEDPLASEMRRAVVWKIIPVHNVDAAAEGLDRRNAGGINLYFDWGFHEEMAARLASNAALKDDPSISRKDFSQPETRAAYDAIMAFQPQAFLRCSQLALCW